MAIDRFAEALRVYRAASPPGGIERGAALEDEAGVALPVDRLVASQELEHAAARDLAAGDADVREAAALKLLALAALDLADAVDALPTDRAALAADDGPSEWEKTYEVVADVLERPAALGVPARVVPPFAALGADDVDPAAAAAALRTAAGKAIDAIGTDAATIADDAIGGLLKIPEDAIFQALGQTADRLLTLARDRASAALKATLRFVSKAASKLLRLLGPREPAARKFLEKQLGGVTREKLTSFAVARVLDADEVRAAVDTAIDTAGVAAAPASLQAGAAAVEQIGARFKRHREVVHLLTALLGHVQGVLLKLGGWAAAALAGVYLLALAYGVWVAGDFLDWKRTTEDGVLDLVDGVRSTVIWSLTPATP